MTYSTVFAVSQDQALKDRCAAAAAEQGVPAGEEQHWVYTHALRLAAQPGWAAAWESALANDKPNPGSDPAVISDEQILRAVQDLLGITVESP
jgi:hypothetical protein